jgi:hypothetical protein
MSRSAVAGYHFSVITSLWPLKGTRLVTVWTDQRNTIGAPDASGDNDGADVGGDPEAGGTCTSSLDTCFDMTGGLDQNIYAAPIAP